MTLIMATSCFSRDSNELSWTKTYLILLASLGSSRARSRKTISETGYTLTSCRAIHVSKCINCRPIRRTAFDRGPTDDYQLVFAKRLQYVSVPDGSDVEVRTRCSKFLLERAERRIMP